MMPTPILGTVGAAGRFSTSESVTFLAEVVGACGPLGEGSRSFPHAPSSQLVFVDLTSLRADPGRDHLSQRLSAGDGWMAPRLGTEVVAAGVPQGWSSHETLSTWQCDRQFYLWELEGTASG